MGRKTNSYRRGLSLSKALFTLTSAESKRLLAKAVARLPEVRAAREKGRIIIGGGTTNAFVAEELLGREVDKVRYAVGIITRGRLCLTPPGERIAPFVLVDGQVSGESWEKVLNDFTAGDVFIKGANAVDVEGHAGILLGNPLGGTIGRVLGIVAARGAHLVVPVGLEKMIPSVLDAATAAGIQTFNYSLGMRVGYMPLVNAMAITEIEALQLFGVSATCLGAGGVGGSEGSVVLAVAGEERQVKELMETIRGIKGEPPVPALKQACRDCAVPCDWKES
jgi:hypothetical protein